MSKMELSARWDALACEMLQAADHLFHESDLGNQSDPEHRVRTSALSVLCRTTNHFAAFRLLMENGFIVEARTLVRSCYENLFWLGGLKEKGLEFLNQMEAADTRSRLLLGKELLNWWKANKAMADTSKTLEDFIESLKNKPTGKISHEQEARGAGLGAAYTMYRILSNDAAHPSAVSLSRHLKREENGILTVCGDTIWTDDDEDLETWNYGCGVLLMVCVATNEVLKAERSQELRGVYERLGALRPLKPS